MSYQTEMIYLYDEQGRSWGMRFPAPAPDVVYVPVSPPPAPSLMEDARVNEVPVVRRKVFRRVGDSRYYLFLREEAR